MPDSQSITPESSVLDAETWISICRAFTTLDPGLQPKFFNLFAADHPVTRAHLWSNGYGQRIPNDNGELPLAEIAQLIIDYPVEPTEATPMLREYIETMLAASETSDYILFRTGAIGNGAFPELIIRFERKAWARHTQPARSLALGDMDVTSSLPEALAKVALGALVKIEDSDYFDFERSQTFVESELLVRAACTVLRDLAQSVRIDRDVLASLYSHFVHITQTPYEKRSLNGVVLVSNAGAAQLDVSFASRVRLDDRRAARKLLEMAVTGASMFSDGVEVLGLQDSSKSPASDTDATLSIVMQGHGRWALRSKGRILFEVLNGVPRLPRPRLGREEFGQALERVFGPGAMPDVLWPVLDAATRAAHGAIVVITTDPIGEAQRLQEQSTLTVPTLIPVNVASAVFAIDGAVLLGLDGTCHAVGVILDGSASPRGSRSRGSRYNSTVRYVDSRKGSAMAVVVSEDNYVDMILPNDSTSGPAEDVDCNP